MGEALYHVLLQGRKVGPYDRRTIVGMRIKKALASADLVQAGDGLPMTVGELLRQRPDQAFQPSRSGSYSVVQAMHAAALAEGTGRDLALPAFQGELELRVQTRALRLAGRYRAGLRWKETRSKIALDELAAVRQRGSLVDLGLRTEPQAALQRLTLELFTAQAAQDFIAALPTLPPWPPEHGAPKPRRGPSPLVWMAVAGTAVLVGGVLVWVLTR